MPTLIYGEIERRICDAIFNISVYIPDTFHKRNADKLFDDIMAVNRMKKGFPAYSARSGKHKMKVDGSSSPITYRVRKMV